MKNSYSILNFDVSGCCECCMLGDMLCFMLWDVVCTWPGVIRLFEVAPPVLTRAFAELSAGTQAAAGFGSPCRLSWLEPFGYPWVPLNPLGFITILPVQMPFFYVFVCFCRWYRIPPDAPNMASVGCHQGTPSIKAHQGVSRSHPRNGEHVRVEEDHWGSVSISIFAAPWTQ